MLYDVFSASNAQRVPVPSGKAYVVESPPENGLCTPELADELKKVLERFAVDSEFSGRNPVALFFRPGIFGHHKLGRAVDIYAVGGIGMDTWKKRWDEAMQSERWPVDRHTSVAIGARERNRNLGWRLYRALQSYGRWAQPYGYPIQLFGPWTRSEGPWRFISDRLLHAHRDHIHAAK
jgi:hypothetical protein